MKTEEEREIAFLIGLSKLTRETGMIIGGCGCCGSPAIDPAKPEDISDDRAGYGYGYAGEVSWISPNDEYHWGKFGASIARD